MSLMTQLVLPFSTPPRFTFENLVVHAGNEEALLTIRSVYPSSQHPAPSLFLYGDHGTGKTHIIRALTNLLRLEAEGSGSTVLLIETVGWPPTFPDLQRFISENAHERQSVFAALIDDVHLIEGDDTSHLWNLSNKLTRSGAPLLMGSRTPVEETFSDNPHLQSRIKSGLVFRLEPPEDAIRMVIVDKLARDRNVRVSREVIHYLISRKSRNIKELAGILDVLDHTSLEHKRRITVPLIKMLEREGTI